MNREDINIGNAVGDRRTYLSPRTEIIKMNYCCPVKLKRA